jgi:serine/threonine protein kinase
MIADEKLLIDKNPDFTDADDAIIDLIRACIEKAIIPFKRVMAKQYKSVSLNENELTQIFVHQIEVQIKNHCNFLFVNKQYYDTYFHTKGVSDFYFHISEEGIDHKPLFVVESKRLPAPDNKRQREREYVIGSQNNGGIERYKIKKHGQWLSKSGMVGFIEQDSFQAWLNRINGWIVDLSSANESWYDDETLIMKQDNVEYCHLLSVAYRTSKSNNMDLSHWWINLCDLH